MSAALPISLATASNFSFVRLTNTMFFPFFASSFAYDFPIPSVAPVTTAAIMRQQIGH